jgi:hypothetical protein
MKITEGGKVIEVEAGEATQLMTSLRAVRETAQKVDAAHLVFQKVGEDRYKVYKDRYSSERGAIVNKLTLDVKIARIQGKWR